MYIVEGGTYDYTLKYDVLNSQPDIPLRILDTKDRVTETIYLSQLYDIITNKGNADDFFNVELTEATHYDKTFKSQKKKDMVKKYTISETTEKQYVSPYQIQQGVVPKDILVTVVQRIEIKPLLELTWKTTQGIKGNRWLPVCKNPLTTNDLMVWVAFGVQQRGYPKSHLCIYDKLSSNWLVFDYYLFECGRLKFRNEDNTAWTSYRIPEFDSYEVECRNGRYYTYGEVNISSFYYKNNETYMRLIHYPLEYKPSSNEKKHYEYSYVDVRLNDLHGIKVDMKYLLRRYMAMGDWTKVNGFQKY